MRILAGTDGSDSANRAIDFAARLAGAVSGNLKIVHVVGLYDPDADELAQLSSSEQLSPGAFVNAMSEQTLKAASQRARSLGVSDVQLVSHTGDIATSIVEIARQDKTDVIVVGKRGRGRLSGLLLGSVSQKLVSVSPCSVTVVP